MTTSNPHSTARIWADIDLSAVVSNARTVAHAIGQDSRVRLLPMVKAGAYGLGAIPVVRALEQLDPWGYGVATLEEGVELRMAGITWPVVVFTPLQIEAASLCLEHHLRPAIGDSRALRQWIEMTDHPFHVEIDTGMARAGFRWNEKPTLAGVADSLANAAGWEGVFTHFHSADEQVDSMAEQWQRFQDALSRLPRKPVLVHAANSAAALRDRRFAGDLVRPGIFLYGGEAGGRYPSAVVTVSARVVAVRKLSSGDSVSYGQTWTAQESTTIATLGCGYADGIHRALGNRGKVEINGMIAPIVGRVTMDLMMAALPEGARVAPGDVATIIGGRIPLDQQAAAAGTISYELLTSLGRRVERYYHE